MENLYIKNFFNYCDSFKELTVNWLTDLENRTTIIALAIISCIGLICCLVYRQCTQNRPVVKRIPLNHINTVAKTIAVSSIPHLRDETTAYPNQSFDRNQNTTARAIPRSFSDTSHLSRNGKKLIFESTTTPRQPSLPSRSQSRSSLQSVKAKYPQTTSGDPEVVKKVNSMVDLVFHFQGEFSQAEGSQVNHENDAEKKIEQVGSHIDLLCPIARQSSDHGEIACQHKDISDDLVGLEGTDLANSNAQDEKFRSFSQQAIQYYLKNQLVEAEEYFEKALQIKPDAALTISLRGYGAVLYELAIILREKEDFEEACIKNDRALELNPNDFFAMQDLADFLVVVGDDDEVQEGLSLLRTILERDPQNVKALESFKKGLNDCLSAEDQQLITRSEGAINEGHSLNVIPTCFQSSVYEEGEYLLRKAIYEEANEIKASSMRLASLKFKETMKQNPEDDFARWAYVEAIVELARCYLIEEKYIPAAVIYCDKALKIVPNHFLAKLIFDQGLEIAKRFYVKEGIEKLERALAELSPSLLSQDNNPMVLYDRGKLQFINGMYEDALATYKEILERHPEYQVQEEVNEVELVLEPIRGL
ncbi:MAG: tetratricopeptide repeat protein [Chlamydiales bacterium]